MDPLTSSARPEVSRQAAEPGCAIGMFSHQVDTRGRDAELAVQRRRGSGRRGVCTLLHLPQHAEGVLAHDALDFPLIEAGFEERARHLR